MRLGTGLLAATGALNVAFSDSHAPTSNARVACWRRAWLSESGCFSGALCAGNHALTLIVATGWAFATGMLVALDQAAADLGAISLITLLVFSASPMHPEQAILAGVVAFCGGVLQTALSVALWPLAAVHSRAARAWPSSSAALAASANGSTRATEPPPTTAETNFAQDALASLDRDRSIEAERYRSLLSQAERIRLGLLVLARLRTRIAREDTTNHAVAALDRFFRSCSASSSGVSQAS